MTLYEVPPVLPQTKKKKKRRRRHTHTHTHKQKNRNKTHTPNTEMHPCIIFHNSCTSTNCMCTYSFYDHFSANSPQRAYSLKKMKLKALSCVCIKLSIWHFTSLLSWVGSNWAITIKINLKICVQVFNNLNCRKNNAFILWRSKIGVMIRVVVCMCVCKYI